MHTTVPLWCVILLLLCITFAVFIWKRRKLYILSAKLKGPFSLPLIGSAHIFYGGHKDMYTALKNVFAKYPGISKIWLGPELYVIDSRPEDTEILLNGCLNKAGCYDIIAVGLRNGLVTGHVDIWKKHRKIINPTFSPKILLTFHETFVKHSVNFVKQSSAKCGKGIVDLFPLLFKTTITLTCETLGDVNADNLKGKDDYVWTMMRLEEMAVDRMCSNYERFNCVYAISETKQKMYKLIHKADNFIRSLIDLKKSAFDLLGDDEVRKKRFLNHLLNVMEEKCITEEDIIDEANNMMVAGSETTAITLSFVLIMLGLYPHIQEQIFKELDTILSNNPANITSENVHKMEYLERVIKETLRVMSPIPLIGRHVQKDITLSDGLVLPAGANFFIPIAQMNTDPKVWEDSQIFNPDRFLPEEVKKRHRCAFIPFSFGARNCIGFKYAMTNMKAFLAVFLSTYKIVGVKYKSREDIKLSYSVLLKAVDGCPVAFEKRIFE